MGSATTFETRRIELALSRGIPQDLITDEDVFNSFYDSITGTSAIVSIRERIMNESMNKLFLKNGNMGFELCRRSWKLDA